MKIAIPLQVGKSLENVDSSLIERSLMTIITISTTTIETLTPTHNPSNTESL
jgi:hypothetical protein